MGKLAFAIWIASLPLDYCITMNGFYDSCTTAQILLESSRENLARTKIKNITNTRTLTRTLITMNSTELEPTNNENRRIGRMLKVRSGRFLCRCSAISMQYVQIAGMHEHIVVYCMAFQIARLFHPNGDRAKETYLFHGQRLELYIQMLPMCKKLH